MRVRIVTGLLAAALGAASGAAFSGCGDNIDDCRNTRTCPLPRCDTDAGDAADALGEGDCCMGEDGGLVCAQ